MSLSSLSVRRGVTFSMLFVALAGLGVFSLSRLQLDLFPEMTFPVIVIITSYPGASPGDVETLISEPIEEAVATVKGIEKITSQSKQGASMVAVEFSWSKDMDQAETDVRRKLDMVTNLPDDAADPIVIAMDPSMQPVAIWTITGDYSLDELRSVAEDRVCERLEQLDGIASCEAIGGYDREIRVSLNPHTLNAFNLDPSIVINSIYQSNIQAPGGTIDQNAFAFNIQTEGKYRSIEEISNVVVGNRMSGSGKMEPILLKHIAEVEDTFKEETRTTEVDGNPAVWIIVRKQSGFNTVKASDAAFAEIELLEKEYRGSLNFQVLMSQAEFIKGSLGNLSTSSLLAIVITFFVLLIMLKSVRSSIIVATAIPLSVVATFFVMDQTGMTLNVISMAGLALAVGMLVDNAIVVLENIFRLRQEGKSVKEACIEGSSEVSMAVTASTLTTVAVFVPILFVPGIAGVIFRDMAVVICFALSISLLVAISFIPLAVSRLYGKKMKAEESEKEGLLDRFKVPYGHTLKFLLAHRYIVLIGLVLGIAAAVAAAFVMPTDFMAKNDQSRIEVTIKAPVGSNLNETREYLEEAIAQVEKAIPEKDRLLIAGEAGMGSGFSAIFSEGLHSGKIRIPLVKIKQRKTSQSEYEAAIRNNLENVPGLTFSIGQQAMGGSSADIEININGYNLNDLRRIGTEIKEMLEKMPDLAEVQFSFEDPTPQLTVSYQRDKMARMGINPASVSNAVSSFFLGRVAAKYSEGDDEHDILVRYRKEYRENVEEIGRMPVSTATGVTVPLSSIANITFDPGPVSISRINQQRVVTVSCILKDKYVDKDGVMKKKDMGGTITNIRTALDKYEWPKDNGFTVGGTAEDFMDSFKALGFAVFISIFLVYMVMASQFESFREPFIILFTMPLALIGVVIMLSATQTTVDVSALIGVIMLVGIVVNNGIVMVDAANQKRNAGNDKVTSIMEAAKNRLRPVLLTSLTTILSMIPLALKLGEGAETWSGMARAVIGGLSSATLLTLIVIPVFYTIFAKREVKI